MSDTDRDRGQATVEFALTLPLVVLMLAVMMQVMVVAVARLDVVAEAGRAARAASMADDPDLAARSSLTPESASRIDVRFDDETVTVSVTRTVTTNAAIIGRFVPNIDVTSTLSMLREPWVPLESRTPGGE